MGIQHTSNIMGTVKWLAVYFTEIIVLSCIELELEWLPLLFGMF